MSNGPKLIRQRERLWRADPRCHWCGVVTVLIHGYVKHPPPNAATIDHLRTRWNPDRQKPNGIKGQFEKRRVLACRKCNSQRLDEFMTLEARQARSGSRPIGEAVLKLADAVARALRSGTWRIVIDV